MPHSFDLGRGVGDERGDLLGGFGAEPGHAAGEGVVAAGDGAAIAGAAQVRGGEKAETAHVAPAAHGLAGPAGAAGLGAVLHHLQAVAIGDGAVRQRLLDLVTGLGFETPGITAPSAVLAEGVAAGDGAIICPAAVLNTAAVVGRGVIVNTAAVVEHHVHLGDCAHVAPNATLCGSVTVGALALVGAGSVVLPDVTVGDGAIVAAATLSNRYIADRFLPDKAIDLMDEAASRLRMEVESKPEEIEAFVQQMGPWTPPSEAGAAK
jgi:acetyltransferase-like isoleucine patch superfamily enzyme